MRFHTILLLQITEPLIVFIIPIHYNLLTHLQNPKITLYIYMPKSIGNVTFYLDHLIEIKFFSIMNHEQVSSIHVKTLYITKQI